MSDYIRNPSLRLYTPPGEPLEEFPTRVADNGNRFYAFGSHSLKMHNRDGRIPGM